MTRSLLQRLGAGAAGRRLRSAWRRDPADAEELRIGYHRADHRHLRPGRQGHGRRLPAVSRRAQQQARRHGREVHRRGRAGQAGHRRHQGQEADPAGQGAHVRRRPAGLHRLRAGAGEHRRKDALHLVGLLGRRPDPARARQISVFHPHRLDELAAAAIRSGNGPASNGYKKIVTIAADYAFGYEVVGGFQRAFEACGGKVIQKIWPPLSTKDFGPYIPTFKADADAIFTAMVGPMSLQFPKQLRGRRQQEAGDRRRLEL